MHTWFSKLLFYKFISWFPNKFQIKFLYFIRRKFGQLKKPLEANGIYTANDLCNRIERLGFDAEEKVFFELGTGWVPYTPLFLSLMGAKHIYTCDLVELVEEEILFELIDTLISKEKQNEFKFKEERLKNLIAMNDPSRYSKQDIFRKMNITYLIDDASSLNLDSNVIDYYFSRSVLEHIEKNSLKRIIKEAKRILKPNGFLISKIDMSDHFGINKNVRSKVNFYRFSDWFWNFFTRNTHSYTNRLRCSDFQAIFEEIELKEIYVEPTTDQNLSEYLRRKKVKINKDFKEYSFEDLEILRGWFLYQKES